LLAFANKSKIEKAYDDAVCVVNSHKNKPTQYKHKCSMPYTK